MSEMVERVARALVQCWASTDPKKSEESIRQAMALFDPAARAAIEAMREPTDAMLAYDTAAVWEIMIDEALR